MVRHFAAVALFCASVVFAAEVNTYNQSLVAALIAHHGVEQVDRWIKGFVNNFARKPQNNDTAQIKAVASGKPGDKDVTDKVAVLWPNQGDRIILLREGLVVQTGTPRELYTRLATAFAAAFFSEVNTLRGTVRGGGVRMALGSVDVPGLPDGAGTRTQCGFQRTRPLLLPMLCGPGSRDAICCPAPCCSIFKCRMKGKA